MKKTLFVLVPVLAFGPAAFAQGGLSKLGSGNEAAPKALAGTEAAGMVKASETLKTKIEKSVLDPAFKSDFQKQREDIIKTACPLQARRTEVGGIDCANAAPSAIEKAETALAALSEAVDTAVKTDGKETLADLYKQELKDLTKTVEASKLQAADKTSLKDQIAAFSDLLAGTRRNPISDKWTFIQRSGSKAGNFKGNKNLTPETAPAAYDKLAKDVADAVALAGDGQKLGAEFDKKSAALKTQIDGSKLAQAFKNDFLAQLAKIDNAACGAKGAAKSVMAKNGAACAPASASAAAEGIDQLSALSDTVTAAIKADGGKSLSDLYQTKIAALQQKLQAAKIDAKDLTSLNAEIQKFSKSLTGADRGAPGRPVLAPTPETAEAAYQKVSDDVDAAVTLAKTQTSFAAGLNAKIKALWTKVDASKLNAQFKNDFDGKLNAAVKPAGCTNYGRGKGEPYVCKGGSDAMIAASEDALSKLSDDVDAAIKADGSQSLAALYVVKVNKLTAQLDASKVDAADKAKLTKRIEDFSKSLQAPGRAGGKAPTVDGAADKFSQLSDDVQAAIDLVPKH